MQVFLAKNGKNIYFTVFATQNQRAKKSSGRMKQFGCKKTEIGALLSFVLQPEGNGAKQGGAALSSRVVVQGNHTKILNP
jgi:hypothetical protein